jgi:CubicO group peptidase (beta-lactamase class C family)
MVCFHYPPTFSKFTLPTRAQTAVAIKMKFFQRQLGLKLVLLVLSVFLGCDDESNEPLPEVPIDAFWEVSAPADQQMDAQVLEDLRAEVRDMPNVYSFLIVRNGKIVHEQYHNGANKNTLLHIRSITKRISALLVGIGIDEGYIEGYQEPLTNFFPEIASASGEGWNEINVYHLLHMISGMDWDEEDDFSDYEGHLSEPLSYIFGRDIVHEPGTYFAYNTPGIDLLSIALERAYNKEFADLTEEKLFEPLGILGYEWQEISYGVERGGTGLELTARDLAKIGLLHRQNGHWQSDQLVTGGWMSLCFEDAMSFDGIDGNHGANISIGNTWWTREFNGVTVRYADGYGGQMLMIIPEHNIVIVMNRNYDVSASENQEAFNEFFDTILPGVLDSVLD